MIKLAHVYKTYPGPTHALANVTFDIAQAELVYLIGPSGAGKTTLFNIINGFDRADSGHVEVLNHNMSLSSPSKLLPLRKKIGVIFQDFRLLEHVNVYNNICLPLIFSSFSKVEISNRVENLIHSLKLDPLIDKYPNQLSGGEKQRIAIARALINNPALVIADEPTGSLDPQTSELIFAILSSLQSKGTTVLISTHNLEMIKKFPSRVITISGGHVTQHQKETECTGTI